MSKSILVVDDVGINLLLPGLILRPYGWTVHEAETGDQALEMLTILSVAYVLLDLNLPDVHGTDLLPRLKAMTHLKGTKVIAYTSYATSQDHERLASAGFDAVLIKPINTKKLLKLLE